MHDDSDTAEPQLREPGTPFGSDTYYTVRWIPAAQRAGLAALYALAHELDRIPTECSEPGVAHTKLAWWREELAAACAGRARHPVTRSLAPTLAARGLTEPGPLLDLAAAVAAQVGAAPPADFAQVIDCCRAGGALAVLEACLLGARADDPMEAQFELGSALYLTTALAALGADRARARLFLPMDELAAAGVAPDALRADPAVPALRALLGRQVKRAAARIRAALDALPPAGREAQLATRIRARLALALLGEIRRDGCRLLERRVALTPVRRLWIAWRTARREGR